MPAWSLAATLIVGSGIGFAAGNATGGSGDAAATTTTTTTVLAVDTVRQSMQRCPDADAGASTITSLDCGLFVTVYDDGGLEVNYFPEADDNRQGDKAIDDIGSLTGCWGSSDRAKMGSTRALDGRVESANGRSSWTYHPDDGLNIICSPMAASSSA